MNKGLMPEPACSDAARREAAVWIARIHSPERTPSVDAGLRRWLKERPEHQRAFELANELWETAARIPDGALPRMMRVGAQLDRAAPRDLAFSWFAPHRVIGSSAVLALIAAAAVLYSIRDPLITTEVGEQRTVTLEDGTRVSLNTATRILVHYADKLRHIRLESGEALFEVAKRPGAPFVVTAGNREITALGTAFIVRADDQQTAVTLVEGKVAIRPSAPEKETAASASSVLAPGERLTFTRAAPPRMDRPKLEKLTAWRRGLVALDYTPLAAAAAEMNRYSPVELVIDSPAAAQAPISGVFRAGDSLFFAEAVAETYGLQVTERPGRIVISGNPR